MVVPADISNARTTEALTVPPDQGPRWDIDESVLPVKAPREEHKEIARRVVKPSWRHFAFLIERELFSKKEIFCRKRCAAFRAER